MDFLPTFPLEYNAQIAFGLLLFAGVLGGYFAHRISWMPSITGFMAVGVLIGPSGTDLLTSEGLGLSRPLIDVALGLILYRLGLSLDLRAMLHDRRLLLVSVLESSVTFLATFGVLVALGLSQLIAGLIAAIVISSSPAILIHIANEVRAEGPVTERAKQLVALNNLLSFLAFSAMLPAGHLAMDSGLRVALLQPVYQVLGSLGVAILLGIVLVHFGRLTRSAAQYRLALIIGALMLGLGIADALNLSALFVPLAIGVVVKTLEKDDLISDVAFGETFEMFFIVLFVYAGAKIQLSELASLGWIAVALVGTRIAAKWLTVFGMTWAFGAPPYRAAATGLLLIPMAGLAIGLAQTADTLFALEAAQLNALVLAAVAILETLGPPIAVGAFRLAGESSASAAGSTPKI